MEHTLDTARTSLYRLSKKHVIKTITISEAGNHIGTMIEEVPHS